MSLSGSHRNRHNALCAKKLLLGLRKKERAASPEKAKNQPAPQKHKQVLQPSGLLTSPGDVPPALLTITSYDRYVHVSICKPLHYGTILGSRACAHVAAAAWASGFLYALMHMANTFSLPLCHGNALGQFFCEVPQILKLSCSSSYLRELGLLIVCAFLLFGCFVSIVFSYVQIFRAVLRIPSKQGQHKAFSTCLPHLAVLSLFISAAVFAYLKPPSMSSPSLHLALSVLYLVVPPALNALIYSLRNQELKDALRTKMTGYFSEAKKCLFSAA
ncbi:olfactory receptor 14J1-like [Molothrus ater]|uniref:olfactory receptor 14J1-like n=1 Tax=Molothrus ater TaxID=84834 RepID=UPI0023E85757|nr:olfactory receptor 14J1-like [Molothrus ater]